MLFTEIGDEGQRRIWSKRVLVVGMGAVGSVSAEILVRAGVQGLGIVDRDYMDESDLQRQSLCDEADWWAGLPKAIAVARNLSQINGDVGVESHVEDVHAGNVRRLFEGIDLVLDGTDNFETRYLLNDASVETGVPWIYAACVGSYGMSFVIHPGRMPCLRCFMEAEPTPGTSPTCDTAGVISPVVHAVASFQVTEAFKLFSGREDALRGSILSLDVWHGRVDRFTPSRPRPECPACERRSFDYLVGSSESQALTLCENNAVQICPAEPANLERKAVATRLSELGEVTANADLQRAKLDGCEIMLFKDGRAIVHGTEEPSEVRSLYARYVGS
jgi:molybdopterin/thiamine biosynthesis adenylyltransferase